MNILQQCYNVVINHTFMVCSGGIRIRRVLTEWGLNHHPVERRLAMGLPLDTQTGGAHLVGTQTRHPQRHWRGREGGTVYK